MKVYVSALVAAFALISLPGCSPLDAGRSTASSFTDEAIERSYFIIAMSDIAAKRSGRDDIRRFATVAAGTYREFVAKLTPQRSPAVAQLPSRQTLRTDAQQRIVEQLMTSSGEQFDEVYLQHLWPSYEAAVAQLSRQATSGQAADPALITKTLRTLQQHLTHIRGYAAPPIG